MRILVTGGTGFVGSHLVERLVRDAHRVCCLVRATSDVRRLTELGVELRVGDICAARADGDRALEGADIVFHVAGLTEARSSGDFMTVNTSATSRLIECCMQSAQPPRRFMYVSSLAAVGPSRLGVPLTEDAACRPISAYGRSKRRGELAVLAAATRLPVTIVRPPVVYGPRDRNVFQFFRAARLGVFPDVGHRRRWLSMIYVEDLVDGLVRAAESPAAAGQVYFVADDRPYERGAIAAELGRAVRGRPVRRIALPEPLWWGAGTALETVLRWSKRPPILNRDKVREAVQDYWVCDAAKARRDFGFRQRTPLPEGLRRTAAWYHEHGWLK